MTWNENITSIISDNRQCRHVCKDIYTIDNERFLDANLTILAEDKEDEDEKDDDDFLWLLLGLGLDQLW